MPRRTALAALSSLALLPIADAAGLRPLSTDRPDTTESPYTVDAGHFQFEMELATWARDGNESAFSFMELNAKAGLSDSTDLQVVLPFFTHVEGGEEGFGDIEVRLKWNLWGNDSGSTALALMPFIKLPTAHGDLGNDVFEGGLIVPLAFEGPAGWSCAVMAEVDLTLDDDGDGYHPELLTSATASHDLNDCMAMFLELVSILNRQPNEFLFRFLELKLRDNAQILVRPLLRLQIPQHRRFRIF